jgi:hypothetical protein
VDATLATHPTLWVHLASLPQNAEAQFTLQDAAGAKQLYNLRFQLPGRSGILGVRLPKTGPALKAGESYFWQMSVQCDRNNRNSETVYIGSWIQRLNPDQIKPAPGFNPKPLVQELARASEIEKPALYSELGIWQDAVTTLIALRQKQPHNQELKEDWGRLLKGAQMSEFTNAPILGVK